ncbi:MAG: CsbD family protein [Vicinamibacterales bacterium]
MNRDELDGKIDQVKGRVKQATGDLTDNDRLRDEGVVDEAAGEVQEGFGRGRRKVGEAIKDLGDSIKR